jgi:hypothetical protein
VRPFAIKLNYEMRAKSSPEKGGQIGLKASRMGPFIAKLKSLWHREPSTNNLQVITFLFMDKKVTKKTIWPQFRITACK